MPQPLPHHSVKVYKASAGSGKTFTLALEYISKLIADPNKYQHILAVTFTNKATAEMKQRILSQLYGLSTRNVGSDDYLLKLIELTGLDEETMRQRARTALQCLIHDYSRFHVKTIDSFFQSVVRNLARELKLGNNLRIDIETQNALNDAVDQLLEHMEEGSRTLKWAVDFINSRMDDSRDWKIDKELKQFGTMLFNEVFITQGEKLRDTLANDEQCIERYRQNMQQLLHDAPLELAELGKRFDTIMNQNGLTDDDLNGKGRTGMRPYFRKVTNGEYNAKEPAGMTEFMTDAKKWVNTHTKNKALMMDVAERELIPLLHETEEKRHNTLLICNSCKQSMKYINHLRLLMNIAAELEQANHEQGRFMLADTNKLLTSMLSPGDAAFVFEKIGTTLQHIMIDEFQDTSRMQWGIFRLLLDECLSTSDNQATQDNDSLIVGDVKQSIYRWRNGDWNILNQIESDPVFRHQAVQTVTLDTNWRSAERVVNFNNQFFLSAVNCLNDMYRDLHNADCTDLLKAYSGLKQKWSDKHAGCGYVRLQVLNVTEADTDSTTADELYLDAMLQSIDQLTTHGVAANDMAILVRTNQQARMVADFLKQHTDYPVVSDEAFMLSASAAIGIIVDAMAVLATDDSIAKARLVMAYQQEVLNNTQGMEQTLLANPEELLPPQFIAQAETMAKLPLFDLAQKLADMFQVTTIPNQEAYLFTFFDKLMDYVQDHQPSLTCFVDYYAQNLATKSVSGSSAQGIRIMTIHKSKGLEFHTVLIPFLHGTIEDKDSRNTLLWCEPQVEPFNDLCMLPVTFGIQIKNSIYAEEYNQERLRMWIDHLNLLYVAFTRAGSNLLAWSRLSSKKSETDMVSLITQTLNNTPCMEQTDEQVWKYGEICASKAKVERNANNRLDTKSISISTDFPLLLPRTTFRQSGQADEFFDGNNERMAKVMEGKMLHELFSRIQTMSDLRPAIKQLRLMGHVPNHNVELMLEETVRKAMDNKLVYSWFDGTQELLNERAIIWHDGTQVQVRRPDRVMLKDNCVTVVDFKFGKPYDTYHEQVNEYMKLIREMGYSNVRGYLWYVSLNEIIEVK